jgi:DNA polymerase-3 subunit delta
MIFAAQRQVAQLHKALLAIEAGAPVAQQLDAMYVHFSRKPAVEAALKNWTAARLLRVMAQLAESQLETRRQPALADTIAQRALLSLATNARRRS